MHLPYGDHVVRFSGLPEEHIETKTRDDHDTIYQEIDSRMQDYDRASKKLDARSAVEIPVAEEYETDTLIDFVLAAWAIVVQRYQRDKCRQLTWGLIDGERQHRQCISAADIDLQSQRAGADVKFKMGELRCRNIPVERSKILLTDGTDEEVCYILIDSDT